MNKGWLYYFGEPKVERPDPASSDQSYRGSRAANARGPARRDYDDRTWEEVTLPHDFVALNGISETDAHGGEHYDFPMDRGSAWYRRYFALEEADRPRRIQLYFEGMGTFCEVYVNDMLMMTSRTNGIGFAVDITDVVRFGCELNVVAVHCDCHDFEAWYYEGGGITRNVRMILSDWLAVDHWGTFVSCAREEGSLWRLRVRTEVRNLYDAPRRAELEMMVRDADGKVWLRERAGSLEVGARETGTHTWEAPLRDPLLWSPKSPSLYDLTTWVWLDGAVVDEYHTTFGVREIRYTADRGMFLNGEPLKIYGFANHMLYLGVGEAMTESMCEYQIRTLKEMGSNGYRTAHSPHQEAIMDWCDRYGLLVMDENRIFHSSRFGIDEVRRMIRRDRNHPCVCMWSVHNEEDFVTNETGRRIFRTMKAEILKLDDTRPVTAATSMGMFSEGAHEDYDLFGFNHQTMNLEALHHLKPDKPIFCSEMILPLGLELHFSRAIVRSGEDARQMEKDYYIGGFHFTAWGYGPERQWIIGMDGTLGPGAHGFRSYLRQDEPYAKVCPGWDFPGMEGREVTVNLANNGDYVKVFLNGREVARVDTDYYSITPLKLVYEPGELRIEAWKDGGVWATDCAVTPGEPEMVQLVCENRFLAADGVDTAIVSAYVADAEGNRCLHDTGRLAEFTVNDAGELVTTLSLRDDGFQGRVGGSIRFFDGKCQAIVRSLEGEGDLVVRVAGEGLRAGEIRIPRERSSIVHVPVVASNYVTGWRISGVIAGEMNDLEVMKAHMVERYRPVGTVGTPAVMARARREGHRPGLYPDDVPLHYVYYNRVTIPDMGEKGDRILALRFEGIDGRANLYISDGERMETGLHESDSPWYGHYRPEWIVPCDSFRAGDTVEIWVMMHNPGRIHGIGWPVHWLYTTREAIRELEEKTRREWNYWRYREDGREAEDSSWVR